jgi:hypothetical protein
LEGDNWLGSNPFYLMIRHPQLSDGKIVNAIVDLDEVEWVERQAEIIGLPGHWFLVKKADNAMPVAMVINAGEKPYYKARHVGMGAGTPENTVQAETIAYGLGKEMPDGSQDMLWHFYPSNVTCMGDDVNPIGAEVLKMSSAYSLVKKRAQEIAAEKAKALNSE